MGSFTRWEKTKHLVDFLIDEDVNQIKKCAEKYLSEDSVQKYLEANGKKREDYILKNIHPDGLLTKKKHLKETELLCKRKLVHKAVGLGAEKVLNVRIDFFYEFYLDWRCGKFIAYSLSGIVLIPKNKCQSIDYAI